MFYISYAIFPSNAQNITSFSLILGTKVKIFTLKMKFVNVAITALTMARSVSAFAPSLVSRSPAFIKPIIRSNAFTCSSLNMAQVGRLTEPANQMLDKTDVFIFDCDGVIWRVSRK